MYDVDMVDIMQEIKATYVASNCPTLISLLYLIAILMSLNPDLLL